MQAMYRAIKKSNLFVFDIKNPSQFIGRSLGDEKEKVVQIKAFSCRK
jgi:hypothetical protein